MKFNLDREYFDEEGGWTIFLQGWNDTMDVAYYISHDYTEVVVGNDDISVENRDETDHVIDTQLLFNVLKRIEQKNIEHGFILEVENEK